MTMVMIYEPKERFSPMSWINCHPMNMGCGKETESCEDNDDNAPLTFLHVKRRWVQLPHSYLQDTEEKWMKGHVGDLMVVEKMNGRPIRKLIFRKISGISG